MPKKEEFVSVMEERDIVPLKDAPIKHRMEEFAQNMGQNGRDTIVPLKDPPIKHRMEEYAKNMEQNGRETVMKGEWYQ